MAERLYPYKILFGELALKMERPELKRADGVYKNLPSEDFNQEGRTILLWPSDQESKWTSVILRFTVEGPESELRSLDNMGAELLMTASAQSGASQLRKAVHLTRLGTRWTGELELPRRLFKGRTVFRCVLTGMIEGKSFRYLGATEDWTLYFEEVRKQLPKGTLDAVWVDFAADAERPFLRRYAAEMFYADVNQDPPVVYLNSKFDNLQDLFRENPRPTGMRMALLEAVRTGIARSVWQAMFQAAVTSIKAGEDGENADWPDVEWKETVLKKILPNIYPNLEIQAALQAAYEDVKAGSVDQLTAAAVGVIEADILREGRLIRKAMRTVFEL